MIIDGYDIAGWYVVKHACTESPIFMFTDDAGYKRFTDVADCGAPCSSTFEFFLSGDEGQSCIEDRGYQHDYPALEVDSKNVFAAPTIALRCSDGNALNFLAQLLSDRMPEHTVKLVRYARIRRIYKRGKVERDFTYIPYTNIGDGAWNFFTN